MSHSHEIYAEVKRLQAPTGSKKHSHEIYDIIKTEFENTIEKAPVNSELKRAVLSHERRDKFLYNMTAEIVKGKKFFTRDSIRHATRDLTNIFINNAERFANERIMSDAEKSRILKDEDMKNEFDKQADEWADQIRIETWDGKKSKRKTAKV